MTTMQEPRYASPVDYDACGEYGPGRGFERGQAFQRPRYASRAGLPLARFDLADVEPTQADWDAPHHRETLTS
jgi:hypothetical protein